MGYVPLICRTAPICADLVCSAIEGEASGRETAGWHLFQLGVLFFGRVENRHIRIGVFPDCKKILIGGLRFRRAPLQGKGAAETQMSQRIEHIRRGNAAMVENLLVFGAGFLSVVRE